MNTYEVSAAHGLLCAGATVEKTLFRPATKLEPAGVGATFAFGAVALRHAVPVRVGAQADVEHAFYEFAMRNRPE